MPTFQFEIKHRWTGLTIWSGEVEAESEATLTKRGVDKAVAERADLYGANLRNAVLCGAHLSGANLHYAKLHYADLRGANLHYADLRWANLHYADLRGANLCGARINHATFACTFLGENKLIDGGLRSDGWRFFLTNFDGKGWRVVAGLCHNFGSVDEARKHWQRTRGGTPLGDESLAILDHMIRLAKIRGWEVEPSPAGSQER